MHRQTLDRKKKVLGSEHPSILDSMNNLAAVLEQQRKYEEEEQMLSGSKDKRPSRGPSVSLIPTGTYDLAGC